MAPFTGGASLLSLMFKMSDDDFQKIKEDLSLQRILSDSSRGSSLKDINQNFERTFNVKNDLSGDEEFYEKKDHQNHTILEVVYLKQSHSLLVQSNKYWEQNEP
ncbi:MAG: hypothetical protein V4507_11390 [Verrucomicrobiota bacterium]